MNTIAARLLLPLEEGSEVDERKFINPSLWFVDRDGYRVVFYRYEPLYRMALEDSVNLRFVAVSLRQSQLAAQEDRRGVWPCRGYAAALGTGLSNERRRGPDLETA